MGSATVYVVAAMAVLVAMTLVVAGVGETVVARHRSQTASDAAALAGALDTLAGPATACSAAADAAHRDGARLTRCRDDGAVVDVAVEVPLPGSLARLGVATARSRAGPSSLTRPAAVSPRSAS